MTHHGILYDEHVVLGATFSFDEAGGEYVTSYPQQSPDTVESKDLADHECCIADMSGVFYRVISGVDAQAYISMLSATDHAGIGDTRLSCVLSGDGSVISYPFIARTGDSEYVILDTSARSQTLGMWMDFVQHIKQDTYEPFANVHIETYDEKLVPIALYGNGVNQLLLDYIPQDSAIFENHRVNVISLDSHITCLCLHPCQSWYMLFVPAKYARLMWRSLLSFTYVKPQPYHHACDYLCASQPEELNVNSNDKLTLTFRVLNNYNLVRSDTSYIGARELQTTKARG